MIKVVFIACLPHSGSTLLSIILGKHPSLVGVGEVRNVLGHHVEDLRSKGILCSCGNTIDGCRFWGSAAKQLAAIGQQTVAGEYRTVLDHFGNTFGTDKYFVDASKKVEVLDILRRDPNVDLRVIHLVRDVRSFVISALDKTGKRRARGLDRSSRFRVPSFFFWHWHRGNQKIQRFVKAHRIPTLQVSYEELCLHTNPVLNEICTFLSVEPLEFSGSLSGSESHVIRGNHMRFTSKGKSVSYDYRWMRRKEWLLSAFLFQSFMKFNALKMHYEKFHQSNDTPNHPSRQMPDAMVPQRGTHRPSPMLSSDPGTLPDKTGKADKG